jgi:hypothetical protein
MQQKEAFLLRLPHSLREEAGQIAQHEGISLNQFIGLALAEKISRIQQSAPGHLGRRPTSPGARQAWNSHKS